MALPPNIQARAEQVGRSVEELVGSAQQVIRNSANISINGIASAVEGSINDAVGAVVNETASQVASVAQNVLPTFLSALLPGFPPLPNDLDQFASYAYKITWGILTPDEINFPDTTYKVFGPRIIICQSGGGAGFRKIPTIFEVSGKVEYFIEDLMIKTLNSSSPKTGHTNALTMEWKIIEPYSMGMLLQSLTASAKVAGYNNYLDAPYLFQIEFIGYDDQGNVSSAGRSKRQIPFKMTNANFSVEASGSEYQCTAIPFNEVGLTDQAQSVKTDTSIKGDSLHELLVTGGQSLMSVLNERLLRLQDSGQAQKADQIVILFPQERKSLSEFLMGQPESSEGATTESTAEGAVREFTQERKQEIYESVGGLVGGALPADIDAYIEGLTGISITRSTLGEQIREFAEDEENLNDIGKAEIVKSYLDGGTVPFGRPAFSEVEGQPGVFSRGAIQVSDRGRVFQFNQGTKIQDIITELIVLSDYGRQISTVEADENGMIPWFRIDVDVYLVNDNAQAASTGRPPRIYVYKVVPYMVHASRFNSPTAPTEGIAPLRRQAIKEYNYIYTGKNKDILDFDIQINSAFFVALTADRGQLGARRGTNTSGSMAQSDDDALPTTNEGQQGVANATTALVEETSTSSTSRTGGTDSQHTETQIARNVNDAIVNSPSDLVAVELEILGDPYFISDSGLGNYSAAESPLGLINVTIDGSMDYQSSECDVILNFRTPIDYGDDGYMDFPGARGVPVGVFSGLYQVITVENNFSGGAFTQRLKLVRRRNQENDIRAAASDTGNRVTTEGTEENALAPDTRGPQ